MVHEGGQDSLTGRLKNTTATCKQPALAGNRLHFDSTILQVLNQKATPQMYHFESPLCLCWKDVRVYKNMLP